MAAVVTVAQAAAPFGAGLMYDAIGDYRAVLWFLIAASIISTVTVYTATKNHLTGIHRDSSVID